MWTPWRFYKESRSYMKGYSNWHFFTRLPRAFIVFYYLMVRDKLHG